MRVLLARQVSTGRYCRRVDGGPKTEATFRTEVAAEYAVVEADLTVVVETWDEATYNQAVTDLAAGTFRTTPVLTSPTQATVPNPYQFRRALVGGLDGINQTAKLNRAKALRQKFPGFTEPFLRAIQGPELNAEEAWWIKALWADARAQVGGLNEIITAGERDRIEALAPKYGIALI